MNSEFDFEWNCFGGKSNIFNASSHVRERVNPSNDRHHVMTYLIGKNSGELENVKDTLVSFQHSVALAMHFMQNHISHLGNIVCDQQKHISELQTIIHQQTMQIQCFTLQNTSHSLQNCNTMYTRNTKHESYNMDTFCAKMDSNPSSSDKSHKHDTVAVHCRSPLHMEGKNATQSMTQCFDETDDSYSNFEIQNESMTQRFESSSQPSKHDQHDTQTKKVAKSCASTEPTKCVEVHISSSSKSEKSENKMTKKSTLQQIQSNKVQARTGAHPAIISDHEIHRGADDQSITDTLPVTLGMDLN